MANEIYRGAPPALPQATDMYNRPYMYQLSGVLRLFFIRLTGTLDTLLRTDGGGKFLYSPHGMFYSTADQSAAGTNTGYSVTFNTTDTSNAVSVASSSRLTVDNDGLYGFDVMLQVENTDAAEQTVRVWLALNGSNKAYTAQKYTVGPGDYSSLHCLFHVSLTATQYVEVKWATSDTDVNLHTESASSPHSGIPSASVAVSYISNI